MQSSPSQGGMNHGQNKCGAHRAGGEGGRHGCRKHKFPFPSSERDWLDVWGGLGVRIPTRVSPPLSAECLPTYSAQRGSSGAGTDVHLGPSPYLSRCAKYQFRSRSLPPHPLLPRCSPLYDWEAMARNGYAWWVQRMGRAFELYDEFRIDHFRGLAGYWAIPAEAETAMGGTWKMGPREEFFEAIAAKLGKMDIIAEDLVRHTGVWRIQGLGFKVWGLRFKV